MQIAIDGPSGAGKSTIAKELSKKLNYIYIDTGAMYRSVALYCLENNISTLDEAGITKALNNINIELKYIDKTQHIFLNGEDVSEKVRSAKVTSAVPAVSAVQSVRENLVYAQQKLADGQDVVMDGRDIGTFVLPDAQVKIFLTASVEVRANRRLKEIEAKGETVDFDELKSSIAKRDEYDSNRAISPLAQAPDAVLVDTSDMTKEEVIDHIAKIVEKKI